MSLASSSVTILPRVHVAARATRRASPVTNAPGRIIVRSGVTFDPLRVLARRRASPRALAIRASASEPPASNTRRPASELERIAGDDSSAPWWKGAAKGAAAFALAASLVLAAPSDALAARSSGRMGGSSFRAAAPSRSYSSPSSSYSSSSTMSAGPSMTSRSMIAPTIFVPMGGYGYGMGMGYGFGNIVSLAFIAIVLMAFLDNIKNMFGGDGIQLGGDAIAVVKVQIGLLGMARDLQLDLEKIADKADTSTTEGLHYVLEETVLALLRNPEYCVYGYATSASARGPEEAEDTFNEFSMDERGKLAEETLVNVNSRKRSTSAVKTGKDEDGGINEYILVTIIAACDGGLKLPAVTDSAELRTALKRVGAIRADALQAVEVIWTPQEEGDTLTEEELLADYPTLNVL
ncbi:predicted protein [Micromonas commoda]|uniref:DUF1517 domain-containing protein n=1 Tax=Micromonas commoda (strain RCC299 / NOUM17 / CCMP2709) TaxID=296587 RepID=C1EFE7_MICCC|nr:predicted protein [Micromonas commoda]ACO67073.1 predicted protein [Micromonas commoda]|eukprot:XP_002505815.1 predicted protein [Micromonas commoda]